MVAIPTRIGSRMGTSLDQQTVNRLAFARYLLDRAHLDAARPEPYSSEALLAMHDAAEWFLVLCAEHLNVSLPKNVAFEAYWSEVEQQAKVTLPVQAPMKSVNKARVALKHHFQYPARSDLERHLARTSQFLEEATPIVFGVDLADISLLGLIRDRDVRGWLQRAEEQRQASETDALAACVMAYRAAMHVYRRDQWGRATPFDVSAMSVSLDSDTCSSAMDMESFADEVVSSLEDVSTSLETLAVGLDLDRLAQLRRYWPYVYVREGKLEVSERSTLDARDRPAGVVDASISWVTEAALHLQEREGRI